MKCLVASKRKKSNLLWDHTQIETAFASEVEKEKKQQ